MGRKKNQTLRFQVKRLAKTSNIIVFFILVIFMIVLNLTNQYQINRNVKETVDILQTQVENYQSEVEKIGNLVAYNGLILRITNTTDLSSMTRTANDIRDMLDILTASNENVSAIILTNFEHVVFGIESSSYKTLYAAEDYILEHTDQSFAHWSFYNEEDEEWEYLYYQKSISSTKGYQYYTIVVYQIDVLQGFLEEVNQNGYYWIMNSDGEVLASNIDDVDGVRNYELVASIHLDDLNWEILGGAGKYYRSTQFLLFMEVGIGIFLLFTLWTVIMTRVIIKNITDPVMSIADFIKSYSFGSSKRLQMEKSEQNELYLIGNGINEMLNELEAASEHLIQAKEVIFRTNVEKQKSELIALQIQINPHFLFNTLNCINGIAVAHEESVISEIVTAMAAIMRYSLSEEKFVFLDQEIECVGDYCKIIKGRYGDRITLEYNIDEYTEQKMIPKMIMQPIIENAVSHGLERYGGAECLWISSWMELDGLTIQIENSGQILTEEDVTRVNESLKNYMTNNDMEVIFSAKHIGMRNVHARLRLLYGEEAGVVFSRREEGGAIVTLRIPDKRG